MCFMRVPCSRTYIILPSAFNVEGIMEHYINGQNIALFKERLMELERSSLTISKYIRDITTFRRWLGDNGSVDKNKVIRFKQMLRENGTEQIFSAAGVG